MKVSKCLLVLCLVGCSLLASANEGDSTKILVHDKVDLTWFGNYDQVGAFPNSGTTYSKVLLKYTMGCSSAQCSDWDYTTNIELMFNTGEIDSNIASIDTVSTNPVVLDTTWNVFDVLESFELGRAITPYGGYMANNANGFTNDWTRVFNYDVTDYVHMLRDSVIIRAHFSGWQNGFSATTEFIFIEGTAPQDVVSVRNIYHRGGSYQDSAQFETNILPAKTVTIDPTHTYKLRVTPSGHGFDNNTNCAEFCERDYVIKVNGVEVARQSMWRDDCGENAVFPQGGTWIYNRANWCPGDYVWTYEHDISDHLDGLTTATIDMDIDPPIVWSGSQAPSYIVDVHLVEYNSKNVLLDAALEEVIAPSKNKNHSRYNPICGDPIVRIKNYGTETLTQVDIAYWVAGGPTCWFVWTGSLPTGASEEVVLPAPDWASMIIPQFFAKVQWPNNWFDENRWNDALETHFDLPPIIDSVLVVNLITNNAPTENSFEVRREDGTVVYQRSYSQPNAILDDTVVMSPGCYTFEFTDYDPQFDGGDGLSFFANNDGNGLLRWKRLNGSTIETFPADFGSSIIRHFTVGYQMGDGPHKDPCNKPFHDPISVGPNPSLEEGAIEVFPNPADDRVIVQWNLDFEGQVDIQLFDSSGRLLQRSFNNAAQETAAFDLSNYPAQVLYLKISTPEGVSVKKLVNKGR